MTIQKKIAGRVLLNLDETAEKLESLAKNGKLDSRVASSLIRDIDTFADKFEAAAFGTDSLKRRQAKVLQRDPDEKFMDTFDNPNKVLQSDSDESYMHKTGPSFNSKGTDNFDQDRSTAVSDRDEFQVRDQSEHSDGTKKQPSWSKGPAGKSTKQGSAVASARPKTWAPLDP